MPDRSQAATGRLIVSASLVEADLLHLADVLESLASAGVDSLHLDLEDGTFVPELNLGTMLVRACTRWGKLPVDVHLMIADPESALRLLAGLPLRTVHVHAEATRYPRRVLGAVRAAGWRPGLAVNPASALPDLAGLAGLVDELLILTTEPDLSGAQFIPNGLERVRTAVTLARTHAIPVVVDGGVGPGNAGEVARAGAAGVVMGRALVTAPDPASVVAHLDGVAR